jgi:asparagine synthase (glutamine-hydrolysing)
VRLIGGVVHADPSRAAGPGLLAAMAAGVSGAPRPAILGGDGPGGLWSTVDAPAPGPGGSTWSVADLDLVNQDELEARVRQAMGPADLLGGLHALDGPGLVDQLRGAFALAIWDRRRRTLLLAVDRFGVKRLYYAESPDGIAFASRPAALLAAGGRGRQVDPAAAYLYLNFGFVPAPHSIFSGVRRLPPGHVLSWRDGRARSEPYWTPRYPERPLAVAVAARRTYLMVEDAVRASVAGADPKSTGVFLSGGTDSSTVCGLAGRITGERVSAFSIGFEEPRYDELGYAALAARHFGAAHYRHLLAPEEALAALPEIVRAYDEPLGNDSTVATYACARLARETGMARLLAGDGGDEIFGGNERYRDDAVFAVYGRVPGPLRRGLVEPLLRALPDGGTTVLGRAQRYVRRATLPTARRFYSYGFLAAREAGRLLSDELLRAVDPEAPWRVVEEHFAAAPATSDLNRLLYVDLKLTIGDNDLYKVTRTAELAGVEVRFPMLDHPLAEFTGTLPAWHKVRGLEKRYLFKRAFRDLLPGAVLRKPKHGFGVPVADWLRRDRDFRALLHDTLLAPGAAVARYFRPGALRALADAHAADATPYYGSVLWSFLMLELWHRQHACGSAA